MVTFFKFDTLFYGTSSRPERFPPSWLQIPDSPDETLERLHPGWTAGMCLRGDTLFWTEALVEVDTCVEQPLVTLSLWVWQSGPHLYSFQVNAAIVKLLLGPGALVFQLTANPKLVGWDTKEVASWMSQSEELWLGNSFGYFYTGGVVDPPSQPFKRWSSRTFPWLSGLGGA